MQIEIYSQKQLFTALMWLFNGANIQVTRISCLNDVVMIKKWMNVEWMLLCCVYNIMLGQEKLCL